MTGGKDPFTGVLQKRSPDGTVLWSVETRGKCSKAPMLLDGKLIVPLDDPYSLTAYDPRTGEQLWRVRDAGGPVVSANGALFARTWRQEVVKVGGWTFPLKSTESLHKLHAVPDGPVFASTNQGTLYCLDPQSGAPLWHAHAPEGAFAADDKHVYVASYTGTRVHVYDHAGNYRERPESYKKARPLAVGPDGTLYVADRTGMFENQLVTGKWSATIEDAAIGELRFNKDGQVLVASGNYFNHRGAVEALDGATGRQIWKVAMTEPPQLTLGPDNTLYARDPFYRLHALLDPAPAEPTRGSRVFNLGDAVVVGGVRVKKRKG